MDEVRAEESVLLVNFGRPARAAVVKRFDWAVAVVAHLARDHELARAQDG